jgi:hypothetical protein
MPFYVYQVLLEDEEEEGQVFEVWQRASDPPLTHHPVNGMPVRRVLQAPRIAGKWGEAKQKARLDPKNLETQGFTQYVKTADGRYERRAGRGPRWVQKREE